MSISLDIVLKRANKVYYEGETLAGVVVINTSTDIKHEGITLNVVGCVNIQQSPKNFGVLEAFYNSAKPIQLISIELDIAAAGKMPIGKTEIPFEVPLNAKQNRVLFETYHGVFIDILYHVICEIKRSYFNKVVKKDISFFLVKKSAIPLPLKLEPVSFVITPESLQNIHDRSRVPRFLVSGRLDSTTCFITEPLTGELVIEQCELEIKSVELQLIRVETCGCQEGFSKDSTEIQNIQIGDGDVVRGLPLPIYMIFPRIFTCPTLITSNFKIEFEVNIVIIFGLDHFITENFAITLIRK